MSSARSIDSVTNAELYDRWAKVYDTDGNILQAIDDTLFPGLISKVLSLLRERRPITITELGCGTGRNTVKLLNVPTTIHAGAKVETVKDIFALDLSTRMISLAKARSESLLATGPRIQFLQFDALNPAPDVTALLNTQADLVISTLVLEHLPLDTFLATVRSFLKPRGGFLVLTNMHADMGRRSQAGFLDEETGQKVQGTSFVYEVQEVIDAGKRYGFVVEGDVKERDIDEADIDMDGTGRLLGKRGRKWVGCKVWFGLIMRLEG